MKMKYNCDFFLFDPALTERLIAAVYQKFTIKGLFQNIYLGIFSTRAGDTKRSREKQKCFQLFCCRLSITEYKLLPVFFTVSFKSNHMLFLQCF